VRFNERELRFGEARPRSAIILLADAGGEEKQLRQGWRISQIGSPRFNGVIGATLPLHSVPAPAGNLTWFSRFV